MALKSFENVGTHPNGIVTLKASAALAKGILVKFSTGKAAPVTDPQDVAFGVTLDSASAADDIVPIAVLGSYTGTVLLRAGGSVSQGDYIAAASETIGGVASQPCVKAVSASDSTASTASSIVPLKYKKMVVGVALTPASSAGDYIEVAHCAAYPFITLTKNS